MYEKTTTVLRAGGSRTDPLKSNRGARQGDPPSSFLFNAVIDEVISQLCPAMGYYLNENVMVQCLAFADDLILVMSTADGMREQVVRITDALGQAGLRLNPAKCATLHIDIDGAAKRWVVNPTTLLNIDQQAVKSLSIVETYKYLGLQAGPTGLRKSYGEVLRVGISRLTRAPLKPQQRMYFLRCHLLPGTYHGLILG